MAPSLLLDDLDQTWLELLDGRDVVRQDTHLARFSGYVHLNAVQISVHALYPLRSAEREAGLRRTHLATGR